MKTAVRYIKHESILIGDTIRVEEVIEDATVIRVGQVASRDRVSYGTDYITSKGIVLYTHTRDNLKTAKIALLDRAMNVREINTLW
jgi:uncharacterized membrane protein